MRIQSASREAAENTKSHDILHFKEQYETTGESLTSSFVVKSSLRFKSKCKGFIMIKVLKTFCALLILVSCYNAWACPHKSNHKHPNIKLGIDNIFQQKYVQHLYGKNIGVLTNHTGVTSKLESTISFLQRNSKKYNYKVVAIFTPEHGFKGTSRNLEKVNDGLEGNVPVYSLYGETQRPTDIMLKDVDVIIYDIQDVGSRSFTYITTLFYTMEETVKKNIKVIVADRPNPLGGNLIDGTMVEEVWRSFYSFVDVPYCYGMTIGELASFFNVEYKINCDLVVIPMFGWKRGMVFSDTGLQWIPPSSHIPEPDTSFYYPMTGILGELNIVSIGVGFTSPFKIIGAPWIHREHFADKLNTQQLAGVIFHPYSFKPYYGKYVGEECHGVKIFITNFKDVKPVSIQFAVINIIQELYPDEFVARLNANQDKHELFSQINGTDKVLDAIKRSQKYELSKLHTKQRRGFITKREQYLIKEYSE